MDPSKLIWTSFLLLTVPVEKTVFLHQAALKAQKTAEKACSQWVRKNSSTKEEFIACDECGQRFVSERAKNVHETTMHADKTEPSEKCNKCGKMFKSARALKTHLDIFHGNDGADEDDFKCSICNKTYSSQRSLNAHMSSHGRDADQRNSLKGQ